jgi:serine/threonine protein kinase
MVGKRIKHYEVVELLGKGGMGVVYKAIDTRLSRPVALKVLKEEIAENSELKKRFLREARSASQISHPAVAQVFDVDEEDGLLYMALEYVEGQTVRKLVVNREIDLPGAVEIAIQVADGLVAAHAKNIVHRDIKSDNIMVTPEGRVKILDFGLAKLMDAGASTPGYASSVETMAATQVGTVMGTVAYMSPEQARAKEIDHRTDLFSLGVVLYEMVIGELPFRGQSALDTMHAIAFEEVKPVTVVRRDVPADLQRILSRCLRKRPEDRYQSAEVLMADLMELKDILETGSQRPVTLRERVDRVKEWIRYSLPLGISGGVAALIVIALVVYLIINKLEVGSLVLLLLIGLPVYRYVRNRRLRMIQRFVTRVARMPEVKAITVSGNLLTVILEEAKANHFLRINSLLDTLNRKIFYGEPLEVAIRSDLAPDEIRSILRDPGVRYLKEDDTPARLLEA